MDRPSDYRITSVEELRERLGEPRPITIKKVLPALDATAIDFIGRSPFLLLATADAEGRPQVSPKGDHAGFVAVDDKTTLLIPDRKGNKLLFGLHNILVNPAIAVIFLVPGTDQTLRVEGTAELTTEPAVLERLATPRHPALLAIRLTVTQCYFHCAKAFLRARLWEPDTWPPRQRISFGKIFAEQAGEGADYARQIDARLARGYEDDI